ncbi:MAG TPA: DEAD/DEAH box helicase, partial [Solirubrobacteraceae bacterium]|nr:DEAD/DEAH box helicase [Solirubrobacteraceae bacterium]
MSTFTVRAAELLPRLHLDPADPRVASELQELRGLWRGLTDTERRDAAGVAEALAAAQAPPPPQAALFQDDIAARRAITGLDRIDIDTAFECRYHGPRDADALLEHFGLPSFRPGQRDAVVAALLGRDSLVVMPTGGGKSLCYQLPGIASDELTVVVSPLIALMADQYRRLRLGGHPVAMIASGMDPATVSRAMDDIRSGRVRIVLC